MADIPKNYDPKGVEARWYKFWEERGYFTVQPNDTRPKYVVVIPPPNVTDVLHLGHALNVTIQDVFVRWKRMMGFATLWVPGEDHAGIATQAVVKRELAKKGITEPTRDQFMSAVWEWTNTKRKYIAQQLRRMGASCDWTRERFTLDEGLSRAVREVFVRLFNEGLIYRGHYIVNWCPKCRTAISDEEVEYEDITGKLWYIAYPIEEGGTIVVATTRPETMLGDTAVAVHPADDRYKKLVGKHAILPLINRRIPIIADDAVDPEMGTGAVKVTPAHDPDDFEIAKRHNLDIVLVMDESAHINDNGGKYKGLDRYAARNAVLDDLRKLNLLVKEEPHQYAVGHCHRCGTVIEPYLSEQWFVHMEPLAKPAIEAVEHGDIKFFPSRWTKTYLNWMYNIKDWCISRQLWWGHRIPVYYCENGCPPFASVDEPKKCPTCGATKLRQDPDVLDTWFSSWLWPFSVFGWPEQTDDLKAFYPTTLLVTAPDIIFFWVARMIMAGYKFMGDKPFSIVYLHGIVRDAQGRKMSKSLGNSIDPIEMIDKYGADAVRFTLIAAAGEAQDPALSENSFKAGRNFINKIWNAYRLVRMLCEKYGPDRAPTEPTVADRWITSRMEEVTIQVHELLTNLRINGALMTMYEFFWHEYCDWYLEIIKIEPNLPVAIKVLERMMRLMHPYIPFITEEIWQHLPHRGDSIVVADYPRGNPNLIDKEAIMWMNILKHVITEVRAVRSIFNVPKGKLLKLCYSGDDEIFEFLVSHTNILHKLAYVDNVVETTQRPPHSASVVGENYEIWIPLGEVIDVEKEKQRLMKEIKELESLLHATEAQLNNRNFIEKAPKEVVDKLKTKATTFRNKLTTLRRNVEGFI